MTISDSISAKIADNLKPAHLEILNESHMHAGPASESHFKLVVVAERFDGMPKVKRHQLIYRILEEELKGPVHALALHLYTVQEWELHHKTFPRSPDCAGKNK